MTIKTISDRSLTTFLSSGDDFLLSRNCAIESGHFGGFLCLETNLLPFLGVRFEAIVGISRKVMGGPLFFVSIPVTRLLLEISRKMNAHDHLQFIYDIRVWAILCEITTSLHRTECFKLRESDPFDSSGRIPQIRDVNHHVNGVAYLNCSF
jgi:hypothetical protein